mmetsp:Transcript_28393/g.79907  ORF Transcript_28393/g.79907 Transcript_28393/m.79907 type:complete len:223 (-) Transcript_28393:153-821(-)
MSFLFGVAPVRGRALRLVLGEARPEVEELGVLGVHLRVGPPPPLFLVRQLLLQRLQLLGALLRALLLALHGEQQFLDLLGLVGRPVLRQSFLQRGDPILLHLRILGLLLDRTLELREKLLHQGQLLVFRVRALSLHDQLGLQLCNADSIPGSMTFDVRRVRSSSGHNLVGVVDLAARVAKCQGPRGPSGFLLLALGRGPGRKGAVETTRGRGRVGVLRALVR